MSKDIQFIKTRSNFIRYSFIEEMEKHLLAFETALVSHNIKVQWVVNEQALTETIFSMLPKQHYNKICFDFKHIPESMEQSFPLVQIIKVEDFENNLDNADFLFVEADFGIVENGSVIFLDKASKNCFNKVNNLFILLDLNKLLVKQNDLDTILALKYQDNPGGTFPSDMKIINSPYQRVINETFALSDNDNLRRENVNITLFLYDNGISKILENNLLRESLFCIDCGKCATVCPVYKETGQFTPIDLIKYNCFDENLRNQNIFENTTLCGNCEEVCPVQIPMTDLLIAEMEMANYKVSREKTIDYMKIFAKRSRMNKINNKMRRYLFVRKYFGKNKKLSAYFNAQKDPFFNITYATPS